MTVVNSLIVLSLLCISWKDKWIYREVLFFLLSISVTKCHKFSIDRVSCFWGNTCTNGEYLALELLLKLIFHAVLMCSKIFYQSNSLLTILDFTPPDVNSLQTTCISSHTLHAWGKVQIGNNQMRSLHCKLRNMILFSSFFVFTCAKNGDGKICLVRDFWR